MDSAAVVMAAAGSVADSAAMKAASSVADLAAMEAACSLSRASRSSRSAPCRLVRLHAGWYRLASG